jgi:hypothetical protein
MNGRCGYALGTRQPPMPILAWVCLSSLEKKDYSLTPTLPKSFVRISALLQIVAAWWRVVPCHHLREKRILCQYTLGRLNGRKLGFVKLLLKVGANITSQKGLFGNTSQAA